MWIVVGEIKVTIGWVLKGCFNLYVLYIDIINRIISACMGLKVYPRTKILKVKK